MLDIDQFKSINDRFGHATGDIVLSGVGDILKQSCENHGTAGRYGGEEFCIVFVGLQRQQVHEMAELIRESVEAVEGWLPNQEKVTISIGFAMLDDRKRRISDLLKSADEALYAAKRQGRNRVVEWESSISLSGEIAAPALQAAV
jgi:diguanylate cyclase (GGDEF)-like protein